MHPRDRLSQRDTAVVVRGEESGRRKVVVAVAVVTVTVVGEGEYAFQNLSPDLTISRPLRQSACIAK